MNLPKQAGAWSRPETPGRITAQTIFDYMDGAGELYVGYRFGHLDVYEYTAADQSLGTILVELYWMQTSDDAFGLLSTDWGGEPVGLGEAAPDDKRVQVVPPQRALYGAGLLRAWSGDLYLRILASRETPHSREIVFALARAATSGRPNPPVPAVTAVLPGGAPSPATGGTVPEPYLLRPDRTCFFRSYLVLNSAYFLASQDLLDLGPQVEGVTTEYRSSRTGAGRMRIVLVRYPSADAARGAAVKFLQGYVPRRPLRLPRPQVARNSSTAGWHGQQPALRWPSSSMHPQPARRRRLRPPPRERWHASRRPRPDSTVTRIL